MKLRQLQIKNFGKLQNCEITLTEGINLICGSNESGKSTIHSFIRGMLYGIQRQRGRASVNDVYSRYEPWENSSYYAGVMRFESGEKVFRITRNFHKNDVKEELVCETDGERLDIEQGDLKVLLGNISENAFDNTVSVGQMKGQTDDGLYVEMRNYMTNYEGSNDGTLDIEKAQNILRSQKKQYENQQKLEVLKQEAQKRGFCTKMDYIQEEIRDNQGKLGSIRAELQLMGRREKVQDTSQKTEKVRSLWWIPVVFAVLAALVGSVFHAYVPIWLTVIVCSLCIITMILFINRGKKTENRDLTGNLEQKDEWTEQFKHLQWKVKQLEELQEEKVRTLENLQNDYQEFCELVSTQRAEAQEIESLQLAIDTIDEISGNMQAHMEKKLRLRISEILNELTDGKYTGVDISNERRIGLNSRERYVPLWQVSRGTVEQVYFALRMAAGEMFCVEEPMPVLLDEVFAMYDEERISSALRWLVRNKEQVLIFTCHKREEEMLNSMGLNFNKILLQ